MNSRWRVQLAILARVSTVTLVYCRAEPERPMYTRELPLVKDRA